MSVGVGLGVLAELMEEEVDEVVGPKGKHDRNRAAVRSSRIAGSSTFSEQAQLLLLARGAIRTRGRQVRRDYAAGSR